MKTIHLLRVDDEAAVFRALFARSRELEVEMGWLELASEPSLPGKLGAATSAGALRAVAVTGEGTLAAKRRGGPARLLELLREYFLGCRMVLVRGEIEAPRLSLTPGGVRVETGKGEAIELSVDELLRRSRRPARTFLRP